MAEEYSPRRLPVVESFALAAVAAPCLFLAFNRGGTPAPSQALAGAWIFLALAIWAAVQFRTGRAIVIPGAALMVLAWPLLQLVPLPALPARLAPERSAELAEFAAADISVAPTISLYPYATARAWLVLAGAVALFLLARDLGRRSPAALDWLSVAVLALAMAEALPALRQYLLVQFGAAPGSESGTDIVRGTFGNRNLFAAWLEGCYGVALGVFAGRVGRGTGGAPGQRGFWLVLFAAAAALVSAVGVVCSFSRMGILALAVATLLFGGAQCRGNPRGAAWLAGLGALIILCAVAVGLPGLGARYRTEVLVLEREGRLAMWADSWGAARRYFPWGAGVGAFPYAFRRSHPYLSAYTIDHPHNEYLETTVEWGIPAGILLACGIGATLFRRVRRLEHALPERRRLGQGCLAGAFAILFHAGADFPLRAPAILALFSVLLGMAAAASPPAAARRSSGGRAGAAFVLLAALGLGALSLWSAPPEDPAPRRLEQWNVEAHYRAARRAFDQGPAAEAEAAYRRALAVNPYAAAVWREMAQLAEARGDPSAALAWTALSQKLEPHTRRGEWVAANLHLRLGGVAGAVELFRALLGHAPELRRAVWEVCWNNRAAPEEIVRNLAADSPASLQEYLQYLTERRRWEALADACAWAFGHDPQWLPPETLRPVFERFFFAGEFEQARRLWNVVADRETGFSNGDLARPLRGYGLDWVVWPAEGVQVERRSDGGGFRLDIDFERPQNIFYAGVVHDFAVTPGREYRLRFEAASEEIGSSSGVQVEVISPGRRLAVCDAFRRSTGWRPVELRFRPLAGERICRLRVIRLPSPRFDNQISGRFALRRVSLFPPE